MKVANFKEPIFLQPVFKHRIWGGSKLRDLFHYEIPHERTGEAWVISAHAEGSSAVLHEEFQHLSLRELWETYPELFGEDAPTTREFPLLVKIIDAREDLSVQVHPDDDYAKAVENEAYGKTECWYVLDCEKDAEIVYGHTAQNVNEFLQQVNNQNWDELLRKVKVKPGDFFFVPSGKVHAIGKGVLILEIQQSSDITYRVYDYDRVGADNKPRELHLRQALDVIHFPDSHRKLTASVEHVKDLVITTLIEEKFFIVKHLHVNGSIELPMEENYLLVNIIKGSGRIVVDEKSFLIQKGDNFILPSTVDRYTLEGDMELIVSKE